MFRFNSCLIACLVILNVFLLANLFYRNFPVQEITLNSLKSSYVESAVSGEDSDYFTTLRNMTYGLAERRTFTATVEIMEYDMSKPLPEGKTDGIECIVLKNATPPYHVCLHDDSKDVYLSKHLKVAFVWESFLQDVIKTFFESNPDAFYIDLGMNIGAHVLYAANLNPNIKVLAVEPFPKNVLRVHKAAYLNNVQNRIKVVMAAISDKRGAVTFHEKGGNIAGNIMIQQGSHSENYQKGFTTTSILMDDLAHFALTMGKKAIMKMDIEGQECHAFFNADKLFTDIDVEIIMMEILYAKKENSFCFEGMLNFLNAKKYRAFYYPYKVNEDRPALNNSQWREWHGRDVYFRKSYE